MFPSNSMWLSILILFRIVHLDMYACDPEPLKYLVINYFQVPQAVIIETYRDFSRKRDYYRVPDRNFNQFGPALNSFKAIADTVNITVLSDGNFVRGNHNKSEYVEMYPVVWTYSGAPYLINKLTNVYKHLGKSDTDFQIFPQPGLHFNFIYCDVPKSNTQLPWNMDTLVFAFNSSVWRVWLVSIVMMVLTLKFAVQDSTFFETCFAILGSTFPDNIGAPNKFLKTPLFYLWIISCFVLSNFYAGTLTSNVISPPEVKSFNYFSEVFRNNFTLILEGIVQFNVVKATTLYLLSVHKNNQDLLALNQSLDLSNKKIRILRNGLHFRIDSPTKLLVNQIRLVVLNFWQNVIAYVHEANSLFGDLDPHKRPVQCYIGKRLIPAGPIYQVMITPQHEKGQQVERVVMYMMESGIGTYWVDENIALKHSPRVQDRSRVIAMTKIRYDFEGAVVAALSLHGKISSVFFLWLVSLVGGSFPVFIFELLYVKWK